MRDFTYSPPIFCGLEDEVGLADANYDGEVDVGDMKQIGMIILGRGSKLTLVDSADRIVTIAGRPIERTVAMETTAVTTHIGNSQAVKKVRGVWVICPGWKHGDMICPGWKQFFPGLWGPPIKFTAPLGAKWVWGLGPEGGVYIKSP